MNNGGGPRRGAPLKNIKVVAIWKCAANNKTPCRARCFHRAGEKHKLRVTNLKTFVGDDACIVPRNLTMLQTTKLQDSLPNCRAGSPVKSNIGNSREERKVTVCGYGDE